MTAVLENDILCLTIEAPGKVYKGPRFDHSGNISQIMLKGKWSFCTTEKASDNDFQHHGQGLYNEFGISEPVGYDDCRVGEQFPKIGVGLLTRMSKEPYDFFASYEMEPFDMDVKFDPNQVTYTVHPKNCRGYHVKLVKTISITGNSFSIEYELFNTGSQGIRTNEYCHNFIAVNKLPIGTGYQLNVPVNIRKFSGMDEAVNPKQAVKSGERFISFSSVPGSDFFFSPLVDFGNNKGTWTIRHHDEGVSISEQTDFIPDRMNLWGCRHVISPELFVKIDVKPGESQKWCRRYRVDDM